MTTLSGKLQADAEWAREQLHDAGMRQAMRDFASDKIWGSLEEAEESEPKPGPVTARDVEACIERWRDRPTEIRAYVDGHGSQWEEHVRQRWLVFAEELEDRFACPADHACQLTASHGMLNRDELIAMRQAADLERAK